MSKNDMNVTAFDSPLPNEMKEYPKGKYEKLPAFNIGNGKIKSGYESLAENINSKIGKGLRVLLVDGYQGIDWQNFISTLDSYLKKKNISPEYKYFNDCLCDINELDTKLVGFLGGDDRIFGKHYPLSVESLFDPSKVVDLRIDSSLKRAEKSGSLTIIYGNGSALVELYDELWYLDLPKDIIQERYRDGRIQTLTKDSNNFEEFYKRSYFIEWPALNRHKRNILSQIDLLIDFTSENEPSFITGSDYRNALNQIARNPFRVKPWFFPGPWGGQFMKGHMDLHKDQPNFAWSFELIVPENGIIIESDDNQLEFSFDTLMFQNNKEVLGKAADQFIYEWPIRFDYLDTIDGGNLSTQVHPRPQYIKKHFGETYTQDETYYIVNSKPGSKVYLGLRQDCDLKDFKSALEKSIQEEKEIDIDKYIFSMESKPHDLFFIPNGTVHCSGQDNLVLEISATPYIFTFKIYDYLRRDLEGKLRPINIERGFENIREERREDFVKENLVSKPEVVNEGNDWKVYQLYKKPYTFYEIYRVDFMSSYSLKNNGYGYGINLVEGEEVELITKDGKNYKLSFLETMIVPAAAEEVKIVNKSGKECKLVFVHVKEEAGKSEPVNLPND